MNNEEQRDPIKVFLLDPMSYTPWSDQHIYDESDLEVTETIEAADVLVSQYTDDFTDDVLDLGKINVIWTLEPRYNESIKLVERHGEHVIHMFNVYTGNVYTDNFYFGPYEGKLAKLDVSDVGGLEDRRIAILATRRQHARPLFIDGKDLNLNVFRSELAMELFEKWDTVIHGTGWPEGVAVGNSRQTNWMETKKGILPEFNFNLCFENTCYDFYVTEKIWDAIRSGCLPIYYGNDTIYQVFEKDSFLDFREIKTVDKLLEVIEAMTPEEFVHRYNLLVDTFNNVIQQRLTVLSRARTRRHIIRTMNTLADLQR